MVGTWCAIFGKKKLNDGHGCVVVRQHNEEASESDAFMAVLQTQGVTYCTLSALTLANNVDVQKMFSGEAGRRVFAGTRLPNRLQQNPWGCFMEDEGVTNSTSIAEFGETIKVITIIVLDFHKQVSCHVREGENGLTFKQADGQALYASQDSSKVIGLALRSFLLRWSGATSCKLFENLTLQDLTDLTLNGRTKKTEEGPRCGT